MYKRQRRYGPGKRRGGREDDQLSDNIHKDVVSCSRRRGRSRTAHTSFSGCCKNTQQFPAGEIFSTNTAFFIMKTREFAENGTRSDGKSGDFVVRTGPAERRSEGPDSGGTRVKSPAWALLGFCIRPLLGGCWGGMLSGRFLEVVFLSFACRQAAGGCVLPAGRRGTPVRESWRLSSVCGFHRTGRP